MSTSMGDTVSFSGKGQDFSNFTGAIEGKGLQENLQNNLPSKQEKYTLQNERLKDTKYFCVQYQVL